MTETERYRDRDVVYAGRPGENMVIRSANPTNYFQAITAPDACEPIDVDAKLFLPPARGASPAVILAPGSLGVGENIETHAATLLNEGFAVCVIDPFGARTVLSTVAEPNSVQFRGERFRCGGSPWCATATSGDRPGSNRRTGTQQRRRRGVDRGVSTVR